MFICFAVQYIYMITVHAHSRRQLLSATTHQQTHSHSPAFRPHRSSFLVPHTTIQTSSSPSQHCHNRICAVAAHWNPTTLHCKLSWTLFGVGHDLTEWWDLGSFFILNFRPTWISDFCFIPSILHWYAANFYRKILIPTSMFQCKPTVHVARCNK